MEETILFKIEVPGAERAVNSLENLAKANKALREERKKLDLDSAQGQARAKEINKTLDENTEAIKNNSSSLEKQRLNIGNYKSALDGVAPGISGFISGMGGMIKASLAFIATPIGLVIASLGAALFALKSYFKGSEEGQNNFNKIVSVGSAILEQFMNVVEDVGKMIFEAINNPKQAIIDFANLVKENIINRFEGLLELIPQLGKAIGLLFEGKFVEAGKTAFDAVAKVSTGIENASDKIQGFIEKTIALVDAGIEAGKKLADLQAQIDRDARQLLVEGAEKDLAVAELRRKAITEELEVKRATIAEAIRLEEEFSEKQVAAKKRILDFAALEVKAKGDDKDALMALATAEAEYTNAKLARYENTFKLAKELEALDEAIDKADADRAQKRAEEEAAAEEANKKRIDKIASDFKKTNDKLEKERKEKDAKDKKAAKEKTEQTKKELDEVFQIVKQNTLAGKALAIKEATVNTYKGATEILNAKSTLPSPFDFITKAVNFAATIASGLGAVKSISGISFAKGGFLGGMLNGPSHQHGGIPFSVGGRVGFEAEGGEAIINRRSSSMFRSQLSAINQAGGGRAFAVGGVTGDVARISEASLSQRDIFDAIAKIRPVVTVEDINVGQDRVQLIENRATL